MRLLKSFLILLVSASWHTPLARSEPSEAVATLMNEPASLFQIGMYRLERAVEKFSSIAAISPAAWRASPLFSYRVTYNYELNKILIIGTANPNPNDNFKWRDECSKWEEYVKSMGGFERDGKLHPTLKNGSFYAQYFSHQYFSTDKISSAISEIDESIYLSCRVYYVEGLENGKRSSVEVNTDFLGKYSKEILQKEF